MIVKKLRAAATALLLGTAVIAAGGILSATPAEAAVRAAVGKPLQAALQAAAAGNYSAAMAQVRQAESVGGLTAEEQRVISQTRQYIEVKSGGAVGVSDATGARAKFDADYRAGRFRETINDEDLLRKYGALDGASMTIIAQAYYRLGDYQGCVGYTSRHSVGTEMLELQARCAYETHDDSLMRQAAEQLVAASGTPEHWNQLLNLADRSKGLSDPQTLDIYRLKYLTGTMIKADDYMTLTQLLLAAHLPSEAVAVMNKGVQARLLVDQRAQRLLALAKQSQASDLASLSRTAAAAARAPAGDDLIKLGQDYTGMGRYGDAIAAIQNGIRKGVNDPDAAQVALAQAYYGAGQKAAALSALSKSTRTPNGQLVARLWSLYMRQH